MRLPASISKLRSVLARSNPNQMQASTGPDSMSIHVPPSRLESTLAQLDKAEIDRIQSAMGDGVADVQAEADIEAERQRADRTDPYAECSYTLHKAVQHREHNRWTDILAYDHALLPGPYLNASWIPPYSHSDQKRRRRRAFIASQAPLPHTLSTFYDQIVRHRVRLIVNLTPFRERGRTKADEYWPSNADEAFVTPGSPPTSASTGHAQKEGGFVIRQASPPVLLDPTLQATRHDVHVALREQQRETNGEWPWSLTILHITAWADFGNFPEKVFARLLDIIDQEADRFEPDAPVWVHCSAGVGRSGTVIAAMMARDLGSSIRSALGLIKTPVPGLLAEAALDGAYKLIDHERRFRPRMVQTGEQVAMVAAIVAAELQREAS